MKRPGKKIYFLLFLLLPAVLPAQEALKSVEEEYYDFLALQGFAKRPALNYRTLSDSVWQISGAPDHPWQSQKLSHSYQLFGNMRMRIYGPEIFMSENTIAPYGNYDGILWQGRGFNALLKSGIRFDGYGLEMTLLPHFAFSQNLPFEIMPSHYQNEYGYFWGYGNPQSNSGGADAPQRFGDKSFFDWDFGDSEIRYAWKTLTLGFGTQAVWLGPAQLNPILHSNNAPAYPKFDIGLRRQEITIPWLGWYAGDIEGRLWSGRLSESDYFDDDPSNDYTMFHGLAMAYAPSFLPGLTLFANRISLVPWAWKNLINAIPVKSNVEEDQKASFGFTWVFPEAGFEVFAELGIDDYTSGGMARYFSHTNVYAAGLKKTMSICRPKSIYGAFLFEFDWMEMSQDFQLMWPYSFYFHHQIIHGYTNRGQWLGNAVSPGGNSQHISFTLYYPKGNGTVFLARNNPDNNFIWSKAIGAPSVPMWGYYRKMKANVICGLSGNYFVSPGLVLSGGMLYNRIISPLYFFDNTKDEEGNDASEQDFVFQHNFSFQLGIKLIL